MKIERAKISARGAVQGVGFRPFVFRLANELRLNGWVNNSAAGVLIEIEGERPRLNEFLLRLEKEKPSLAVVQSLECCFLEPTGHAGFEIRESVTAGSKTALILPDIAPCADCLHEMFDPRNRRFLYPFTNCTHCGPRFSIIESLPYDRANTSMKAFVMCPDCMAEYRDPGNRRFHAQPNACPACGPRLEVWNGAGKILATQHDALLLAAGEIREGKIVALKSVGGFQLLVAARHEGGVQRLRENKNREAKPFAVVFPNLDAVKLNCKVDDFEARLLMSVETPIVLLKKKNQSSAADLAGAVAPGNPFLGAMLPCSPLHHILLRQLNFPVVATSGNPGAEPLCTDERQALERLKGIADFFLVHNRPIVRQVDDSVARIVFGREQIMRRARGYAPLPLASGNVPLSVPVLAVGAHLKNSVALASGENIFVSQHIGDLET
ncbi:MAG TPA: carbamoyltransferase HypF, partial [Verrucomicrobiae bacterium]|nr:carbamoyltransferase HypF [Verrucomicrobiae bacterium]